MGIFMTGLTPPQAFASPIVWSATAESAEPAPELSPVRDESTAVQTENMFVDPKSTVPEGLHNLADALLNVSPPSQHSDVKDLAKSGSPRHMLPTASSLAKQRTKVHKVSEVKVAKSTRPGKGKCQLLDDSGLSHKEYNDVAVEFGFPKHMLETTVSLMKRRRKANSPITQNSPKCTSPIKQHREGLSDSTTRKRLSFKADSCNYARQTVSSKLKCRLKLHISHGTALEA